MRNKSNTRVIVALFAGWLGAATGWANNIAVTNAALISQVPGSYWNIRCSVQWENSWRCDQADTNQAAPYNYDAAWVFVKYQVSGGAWQHASLSTNPANYTVPANAALSVGLTGTMGAGVFLYRGTNGAGSFAVNDVGLRWDYAADGVADSAVVTVKVCAIEMVYVPQGSFYVGDGLTTYGQFCQGGGTSPYQITNEDALTIGNGAGQLYYAAGGSGQSPGDHAGSLPVAFPKGFAAFYGMKCEISQGQYVDFLNTLSSAQAANRFPNQSANRNGITVAGGVYATTYPYVACNWLGWPEVTAYLDWAALRPMTELEFEKACRGPSTPLAGEYAWGTGAVVYATGISNGGQSNESPSNVGANCVGGNLGGVQFPMRVGCLGVGTGTRIGTGAGYYGMMDLSGNVWEKPVSVGDATGRNFTGLHGDGALDATGLANVTAWPGSGGNGVALRGGVWDSGSFLGVSDRSLANLVLPGRYADGGGRGVRTAP